MTEQEKQEIISELEHRIEQKYKGYLHREDVQKVLRSPRNKWFCNGASGKDESGIGSPMNKLFGNVIYWQVWELIRKLTCLVCGKQYVRHLADVPYADEVAEKICQFIYDLKTEYSGKEHENQ